MIISIILLVVGLVLIVFGADYFIAASSLLAKRYGIPKLIIGLTIVAIGTSAPELGVNIIASLQGHSEVALGNILGSNISNVLLIFPIAALFATRIPISKNSLTQLFLTIPVSLVILICSVASFDSDIRLISHAEGLLLILMVFLYWFYLYKITKADTERLEDENLVDNQLTKVKKISLLVLITVGSLAALLYGSSLVTDQAVFMGRMMGISELTIAGTIIAIGTSLPELITCIQAVRQKQFDLMIGNIAGSNIINTLLVLGVSGLIRPAPVSNEGMLYLYMNCIASVLIVAGFTLFVPRGVFRSICSLLFLALYIAFLIFLKAIN